MVLGTAAMAQATAPAAPRRDAYQEAGDEFEALMLQHLYNQMQNAGSFVSEGEDNPFAPSPAEKIFRGMRDEVVMKRLATQRPLGFGDMVTRQLKGQGGIGRAQALARPKLPPTTRQEATAEVPGTETSKPGG
ncbi:MAG: rod-binding protein [Bdellovibrionales bacterium]|nr:rod-binding protein [Bdellovibrionales bacterium]